MSRISTLVLLLGVVAISCAAPGSAITPTAAPSATAFPTLTPYPTPAITPADVVAGVTVGHVNLRGCAGMGCPVLTVLAPQTSVVAVCYGSWCYDRTFGGWFWRGCIAGQPGGCAASP